MPKLNFLNNLPEDKRKMYIVLAAVIVKITLLAVLCYALSPNPIWGPRVLRSSPVDVELIERLDGHVTYFGQEEMEAWMEATDQREGILGELNSNDHSWREPNEDGGVKGYGFGRGLLNTYARVYIDGDYYSSWGSFSLSVYDTLENASEWFQWERERYSL